MHVVDGKSSPEFTQLMVWLAAAFPTTGKLSASTILAYGVGLAEFSVAEIGAALRRAFSDGSLSAYFPSLPELRKLLVASADDAALLAWMSLRRAAEDVGAWASVSVEDAAAGEALVAAFGSWAAFCAETDGPALSQRRAEFVVAYRDALRRRVSGERRLAGLCEQTGGEKYVGGPSVVRGTIAIDGAVRTAPDVRFRIGGVTE